MVALATPDRRLRRNVIFKDISRLSDDELLEYLVYTVAHERTLTDIEAQLHSVENPEEIAMYALYITRE